MRRQVALFAVVLAMYAYFSAGFGFNQNAHFNTTRALVERQTFEISAYLTDPDSPTYTWDVAEIGGKIYSNKPPGLPIFCAPAYVVIRSVESTLGISADTESARGWNLYLLTLWGSALPATLLVVGLFNYFAKAQPTADALMLAAGFAFGSFLLPYSGMLMVHIPVAALLFFAWRLLDANRSALLAGVLVGVAITFDLSIAPLSVVYAWLAMSTQGRRSLFLFAIGPAVGAALVAIHQRFLFGGFFTTPHGFENKFFLHSHLFLGHFDWPDPRRLYWLTIHPLRGVFYLCPVFVIPLLSLLPGKRGPLHRIVLPLAVIAYFLIFNLCFDGWSGGWGAGPRYLIPATPFLMIFAGSALARFRVLCIVLILVSCLNMLAITAVRAQFPAPTFGPPTNLITDNPPVECLVRVRKNQLAHDRGSFNWGLRAGLPGKWSLIPPLMVGAILAIWIARLRSSRSMGVPPMLSEEHGRDAHATGQMP